MSQGGPNNISDRSEANTPVADFVGSKSLSSRPSSGGTTAAPVSGVETISPETGEGGVPPEDGRDEGAKIRCIGSLRNVLGH